MRSQSRTDNSRILEASTASLIGVISSESTFSDPKFDPVKYTNDAFTSRTVPEARTLVKELNGEKELAASKMTRKVLQNYKVLLDASKEVNHMESGFAQLRAHMTEMHELIGELKETAIGIEQRNSQEAARASSRAATLAANAGKGPRDAPNTSQLAKEVHVLLDAVAQLDLLLPLHKYAEAAEIAESAQKILTTNPQLAAVDQLRKPLEDRVARLSAMLLAELRVPLQILCAAPRDLIGLLLRLGYAEKAREVFLERSSDLLRASIKEVREHGSDAVQYTSELSAVFFLALQQTLDQLQDAFAASSTNNSSGFNLNRNNKESGGSGGVAAAAIRKGNQAAFVVWAVKEVDDMIETHLRSQVFQRTEDLELLLKCVQLIRNAAKPLEDKGISLYFHLDALLRPVIVSALKLHLERLQSSISQSVDEDEWISKTQYTYKLDVDAAVDHRRGAKTELQLTDSGQLVYSSAQKLISHADVMVAVKAVNDLLNTLESLLQHYLQKIASLLNGSQQQQSSSSQAAVGLFGTRLRTHQQFGESQLFAVLLNVAALLDDLLPHARIQIENRAGFLVPEFNSIATRLNTIYSDIQVSFARRRAEQIVVDKMDWEHVEYAQQEVSAEPTAKFQKLSEFIPSLLTSLKQSFGQDASLLVGRLFVEELLTRLAAATWLTKPSPSITSAGAKQLVVDLKFFQSALAKSPLTSATSTTSFSQLIAKANSLHQK